MQAIRCGWHTRVAWHADLQSHGRLGLNGFGLTGFRWEGLQILGHKVQVGFSSLAFEKTLKV